MRYLPRFSLAFLSAVFLSILGLSILGLQGPESGSALAHAANPDQTVQATQYLQEPGDGMAQYGARLMQSSLPSETLQALSDWHAYATQRSAWGVGLTATLLDRLATAEWNRHQSGMQTITPEQLANATASLINSKLAAMTAQEQQAMYEAMLSVITIKGRHGLNAELPYVTATQGPDGKWTVTVNPLAFSERSCFTNRIHLAWLAPARTSIPAKLS